MNPQSTYPDHQQQTYTIKENTHVKTSSLSSALHKPRNNQHMIISLSSITPPYFGSHDATHTQRLLRCTKGEELIMD